ncbi:hypothetical protein [Shinella sp.]|uniref:hypothetical protein n=1 Tax=Shinella sp. TaxID=1870904 RepID=UPI0039E58112
MQLNPSSFATLSETVPEGTEDEEAARIQRLVTGMSQAKKNLDDVLANLARLKFFMTPCGPDEPSH